MRGCPLTSLQILSLSPWSFCLRVSGAVAPSAPGRGPGLSHVDGGGYRRARGAGQGRAALRSSGRTLGRRLRQLRCLPLADAEAAGDNLQRQALRAQLASATDRVCVHPGIVSGLGEGMIRTARVVSCAKSTRHVGRSCRRPQHALRRMYSRSYREPAAHETIRQTRRLAGYGISLSVARGSIEYRTLIPPFITGYIAQIGSYEQREVRCGCFTGRCSCVSPCQCGARTHLHAGMPILI
jgi:hypothetical protein